MELKLVSANPALLETDAVVLIETEGGRRPELAAYGHLYESGEISGKLSEFTLLHSVPGISAHRVLLVGGGKAEKLDPAAVQRLAGAAVRHIKGKGVRTIAISLDGSLGGAAFVEAAARGILGGIWEPDVHKTKKASHKAVESISIVVPDVTAEISSAFEKGTVIGEAINVSRDIAVEPPNLLTPLVLADRARAIAEAEGLSVEILDRDRMTQLGMGSLLGVAQGSDQPPVMIVIRYTPEVPSKDHLGLVGKAVTFDTGGISIKPSEGMEKMKYDMCGGAAVIGAMQAIARLKPPVAVTAFVPSVENMPGANAQRPSDIVKSYSGKTIEVLNTDAEGRLILVDAIEYAKQLGCTHLVDAATLTGAIVVALGFVSSGVFTNNDGFLSQFLAASKVSNEKMWPMPLDDDYSEQLKCVYADIQNIAGSRWGGACTAAAFLKEFVGDTPWVHVDCAGTAWIDDAKPHLAKGPVGIPLATFVNLALNW